MCLVMVKDRCLMNFVCGKSCLVLVLTFFSPFRERRNCMEGVGMEMKNSEWPPLLVAFPSYLQAQMMFLFSFFFHCLIFLLTYWSCRIVSELYMPCLFAFACALKCLGQKKGKARSYLTWSLLCFRLWWSLKNKIK